MIVDIATAGDRTVQAPRAVIPQALVRIRPRLVTPLRALLRTGNPIMHSPALVPSFWSHRLNASDADVVHLHSVQGEMLSIGDIGRIRKPIVWTLHDMWAFCGAEHYSEDLRWREGYQRGNRPAYEQGFDLNRFVWKRKSRNWRRPMHIVCPSSWLADCVRSSALMHDWPVSVVPNTIDIERFQPIEQALARKLLGLPPDVPLLLFGALGGGLDPRKGFDLLLAALQNLRLSPNLRNMQLVVFGQGQPEHSPDLGFPIHYTGHLHDDLCLRVHYSAADLLVVPSRQDNLPNTGLEAHACGTPVVAFATGGLPDIVSHRQTGYLAEPFDPKDLAAGISWVLSDPQRKEHLCHAARDRARQLWNPSRVAGLYREIYGDVLAAR